MAYSQKSDWVGWKNQKNKVAQKIYFWTFLISKHIKGHGSAKVINVTIQWHSHWGPRRQSSPLDSKKIAKNQEKEGENQEKEGEIQEKEGKIWKKRINQERFFHFAPPDWWGWLRYCHYSYIFTLDIQHCALLYISIYYIMASKWQSHLI